MYGALYLVCTTLLLVLGCNYNQRLSSVPLEPLPEHDKISLRTALVLTNNYCETTYRVNQSRSMRPWIYRLGKPLCAYSEAVARDCFSEITVFNRANPALGANIDIIMTPRVVAVLVYFPDFPQSIWEEQEAEIILEWTIADRLGHPLWTRTVGGVSQKATGSFLTRARRNRHAIQQAMHEVFVKFREVLWSADEIRGLAAAQR